MYQLLVNLRTLLNLQNYVIDNHVFRLHYKFSFFILLALSILLAAKQNFGDTIACESRDDIPTNQLNAYCLMNGTHTYEDAWSKKVGVDVPYSGVDKYSFDSKKIYYTYYQWACYALFLQALFFLVPRFFWRIVEGGRLKSLLSSDFYKFITKETIDQQNRALVDRLSENKSSNVYFWLYSVAEAFNLLNVISQMIIINRFIGTRFFSNVWQVVNITDWSKLGNFDSMKIVFPDVTKCEFNRYGSSGDVQRHSAMCILPINAINEKVYVFIWFWFCFLFIYTLIGLVYMLSTVFLTQVKVFALQSHAKKINERTLKNVVTEMSQSDWFTLYLLSKNLDANTFYDLINELDKKDNPKDSPKDVVVLKKFLF